MEDTIDVYYVQNFAYFVGKMAGSICYNIQKNPTVRISNQIKPADIILGTTRFLIVCFLLINVYFEFQKQMKFTFMYDTSLWIICLNVLCIPFLFSFGFIHFKNLIEIWIRLDNFSKLLKEEGIRINYTYIKKINEIFIIFILLLSTMSYVCNFIVMSDFAYSIILFAMCSLIEVSIEGQIVLLLFISKTFSSQLNKLIISKNYTDIKKSNNYLKYILNLHMELFDINYNIFKTFQILILRFLKLFCGISYSIFNITMLCKNGQIELLFVLTAIFWNISNNFGSLTIVNVGESVLKEV